MYEYKGPVFIVGKPRSGTKLIYSLLTNHPQIKLADEMQFLTFLFKKNKICKELKNYNNFSKFYNALSKSHYFSNKKRQKKLISAEKWYSLCEDYTIEGVIEVLVRYYTKSLKNENIIWGIKSPNYINHIKEIKKYFKHSKFIHIIRDPRDTAISAHKLWGTNIYRFAQRWYNDINTLIQDKKSFEYGTCLEIKYEDLVSRPKETINKVLRFLGLTENDKILFLKKPSENYGNAKGSLKIKSDNTNKYLSQMDHSVRLKIESITYPLLDYYGYRYSYQGENVRLKEMRMLLYKICDLLNRLKFEIRNNRSARIKSIKDIISGHLVK